MACMRRLLIFVLFAAVQASVFAQPRLFNQAELDALLAPVALYPDTVLSHVLVAATYPDDVREAAAWSRVNAHLTGDEAVRAAEPMLWDPSLKALLAFPDLLARMDESPQWTADLGAAFLAQEPHVMDTIQALRRRAQASGVLQSNAEQQVLQQGQAVIVQPTHPQVVYVPYYDPYVVYGPWWWPAYRPVVWRPWHHRPPAVISSGFFIRPFDWHRRHVPRAQHHHVAPRQVHIQSHARPQHRREASRPNHPRPIVQGAQIRPFLEHRDQRFESRREHRSAPRRDTREGGHRRHGGRG